MSREPYVNTITTITPTYVHALVSRFPLSYIAILRTFSRIVMSDVTR